MAKISADFSTVKTGEVLPEGDYELIVDEVEEVEPREKGKYPYLKWTFKVADGENEGRKLFDNTSLAPAALWRLRALLVALGFTVPKGTMEVDLDELPGTRCAAAVIHEKYEGKNKARISEFYPSRSGDDADGEGGGPLNLDAMGLGELIEYARSKSVDLTGCDLKKRAHIERAIQEAA